jgi:hypothetical protein
MHAALNHTARLPLSIAAVTKRAIAPARKIHKYGMVKYLSDTREAAATPIQAKDARISDCP